MPLTKIKSLGITDGTVLAADIADGSVTAAKLAAGTSGNGPAFSAYQSDDTTISNTTSTKIQFNTEEFDTASCYDNATNYRFTPNVSGYYQINTSGNFGQGTGWCQVLIYKNGSSVKDTSQPNGSSGNGNLFYGISALIYMNGTTDYLEVYAWQSSGGTLTFYGRQNSTFFQASLVRIA